MEKKINKKQKEVQKAQFDRAKRKVTYDSVVVIIEGQRNTIHELEATAELMQKEYVESDNIVQNLMKELNEMSNDIEENKNEGPY
jgi:predicted transcriptional regulator